MAAAAVTAHQQHIQPDPAGLERTELDNQRAGRGDEAASGPSPESAGRSAIGWSFSGKRAALAAVSSSGTRSSAPLALRLAPPQYSQDRTPVRGWRDISCISPVAGRQRVAPGMAECPKRVIAGGQ